MRTFMIPDILRSRFDRKQSEREAAAAKQETEAEKQRRQKAEIEDRQRKLIAASVDGDKIPAKDADWLAEQYESDLDFERDAETYLKAKAAAEDLARASEHDRVIQLCKARIAVIDERIGSNDYKLQNRSGDVLVKKRGELVDQFHEAKKHLETFIESDESNLEELSASVAVVGEWDRLSKERHVLALKAEFRERKFNGVLGRVDFESTLVDPYSNNEFPLSFALSGATDSVSLAKPKLSPCPLLAVRRKYNAEREVKQAELDRADEISSAKLRIERAQTQAHDSRQPKQRREEAAARAEQLKRELASIT